MTEKEAVRRRGKKVKKKDSNQTPCDWKTAKGAESTSLKKPQWFTASYSRKGGRGTKPGGGVKPPLWIDKRQTA